MRKKTIKRVTAKTIVLVILCIFFLTISIGYSYLKQTLTISGKTTMAPKIVEGYIQGNSTYKVNILEITENEEKTEKNYKIKLEINNKDKDISNWNVSFNVPKTYNDANSLIITNCYKKYQNNKLVLSALNNGFLEKGDTLELEFQIAIGINDDFYIDNLVLNELAVIKNSN